MEGKIRVCILQIPDETALQGRTTMGMIDTAVLRGHNGLLENAEPDSINVALFQATVVQDMKRTGRAYRQFLDNGAKVEIVVSEQHIIDCRRASRPADWTEEKGWKI